jgi:hypothetical protein
MNDRACTNVRLSLAAQLFDLRDARLKDSVFLKKPDFTPVLVGTETTGGARFPFRAGAISSHIGDNA